MGKTAIGGSARRRHPGDLGWDPGRGCGAVAAWHGAFDVALELGAWDVWRWHRRLAPGDGRPSP